MCTLIALHRCIPGATLVVAANRDEFEDRPALGPALRETEHGILVAPLDARAGGTWLGVGGGGMFAAITNRRSEAPDPGRRSRGYLVFDALAAGSANGRRGGRPRDAAGSVQPVQPLRRRSGARVRDHL